MGKYALITRVGVEDVANVVVNKHYEKIADVKILVTRNANEIKFDQLFKELKRLKLRPSEIAMDLLIIASSMYTADTRINRKKAADDSWTREIDLYIPVSSTDVWDSKKKNLELIFRFLTGDIWNLYFRDRSNIPKISPNSKLKKFRMPYQTDTVCLFSGGMDSFIGAINLLSNGVKPLLLGHAKSADVSPYQKHCLQALRTSFPSIPLQQIYSFLRVPKVNLFDMEEKTERGRSFLFLALGGVCASSLAPQSKLFVPENGVISLNLPLTPLRVGSHSTRTTHPYYMNLMQNLFTDLNFGVKIENPFQFQTKGEMLSNCAQSNLLESTLTMSCSHPAGRKGEGTFHCGYCVPCIIRQASFKKAGIAENQRYKVNIFDRKQLTTNAKRDNLKAFNYMIEKVKNKPTYINTLIRATGPLGEDVEQYINVYLRGLEEVEELLSNVKYD